MVSRRLSRSRTTRIRLLRERLAQRSHLAAVSLSSVLFTEAAVSLLSVPYHVPLVQFAKPQHLIVTSVGGFYFGISLANEWDEQMALIHLHITPGRISRLMMWIKLLFLGRSMRRFHRFWGRLLLLLQGKEVYRTDFLTQNNFLSVLVFRF